LIERAESASEAYDDEFLIIKENFLFTYSPFSGPALVGRPAPTQIEELGVDEEEILKFPAGPYNGLQVFRPSHHHRTFNYQLMLESYQEENWAPPSTFREFRY